MSVANGVRQSWPSCFRNKYDIWVTYSLVIFLQVASKRLQNAKSDKFHGNIHKRGKVGDEPGQEVGVLLLRLDYAVPLSWVKLHSHFV